MTLEPVGHYAVKPSFSDGHDSGIYAWDYLYELGTDQERLWAEYLQRLEAAGASREPIGAPRSRPAAVAAITDAPARAAMSERDRKATHFGFEQVAEEEKATRVAGVFDSVASRYDLMNDVMSAGTASRLEGVHGAARQRAAGHEGARHRRRHRRSRQGVCAARRVDAAKSGSPTSTARCWPKGRDRLLDAGLDAATRAMRRRETALSRVRHFDRVSVAFGLRNMTHKDVALAEMARVLRPGGRLLVLEFSRIWQPLGPLYDAYSFNVLPWLGKKLAGDSDSYRYLAESIRMHPPQQELAQMMERAGFEDVQWFNLTAGVCALHVGTKY